MSDYYTHENTGDYEVTFCTEDKETYKAVENFCRQMIGHLKPNEPKYELPVHAHWIGLGGTFVPLDNSGKPKGIAFCSHCKEFLTGSDEYKMTKGWYCPSCGAKMDEEEPDV